MENMEEPIVKGWVALAHMRMQSQIRVWEYFRKGEPEYTAQYASWTWYELNFPRAILVEIYGWFRLLNSGGRLRWSDDDDGGGGNTCSTILLIYICHPSKYKQWQWQWHLRARMHVGEQRSTTTNAYRWYVASAVIVIDSGVTWNIENHFIFGRIAG